MVSVEALEAPFQFEALREEWEALRRAAHGAPFISHDWVACCLQAFGDGRTLFILVARDREKVVGIAPLWRSTPANGLLPRRVLSFITAPDTQFADLIAAPPQREAVAQGFVQYLTREAREDWDLLVLAPWPQDSPNAAPLDAALRAAGRRVYERVASMSPRITIIGSWEEFLKTRSVQFRKGYRGIIHRVERLPNLELSQVPRDRDPTFWRDVQAVTTKSWKAAQGIAFTSNENTRRFFELLTPRATEQGWLLAWLVRTEGRPIAMEYDLVWDQKVFALRADFDEEYRRVSPGSYLEYQIVRHCFAHGYVEYHSGPGLRGYKMRWTEDVRVHRALTVCNETLGGQASWAWNARVRPFLRKFRGRDRQTEGAAG